MTNFLKDALRRATARLRKALRRTPPAYLTDDVDVAIAPELATAADFRSRTFPTIEEFARQRLGDDAPSARSLCDAVARSTKTIPAGFVGTVSLMACPCQAIVSLTPDESAHDLKQCGWRVIESWFCDNWRVRRWRIEAEQSSSQSPEGDRLHVA